jgi:hypothetical protein
MTSEQLRKMIRARPFEPFRVFLADGRELKVQHPEMVAVSATGRTAIVMLPDAEDYEVIDLLLVTGLRRANGAAAGDTGTPPGRAEQQ